MSVRKDGSNSRYLRPGPHRPQFFGFDPEVCWGVFIGGCVELAHDEAYKIRDVHAHAHTRLGTHSRWKGWICVVDARMALGRAGRPSWLLLHEYAHLIAGEKARHGPVWRAACRELGLPADKMAACPW